MLDSLRTRRSTNSADGSVGNDETGADVLSNVGMTMAPKVEFRSKRRNSHVARRRKGIPNLRSKSMPCNSQAIPGRFFVRIATGTTIVSIVTTHEARRYDFAVYSQTI